VAEPRRWFDSTQPQTLQTAVVLCYLLAVLGVLFVFGNPVLLFSLALVFAGYGVANEKRWGYYLGIVVGAINVLAALAVLKYSGFSLPALANVGFMVAVIALFLHPQSREYQRVWFK
jgi:hypothetical protein